MNRPAGLPNPLPRPPEEYARLKAIWQPPRGLRFITVINNNYVGVLYVGAAFLFFVLAGILALLIRTQLAVPNNDFIGPEGNPNLGQPTALVGGSQRRFQVGLRIGF